MVNFENGVVPINDTNLNKLQTDLMGVILYEDETGITGTSSATLNQAITDFKRAKIVYDACNNNGVKFTYGNIKEIDLTGNLSDFQVSEVLSTQSVYATFSISENQLAISRNRKLDNNAAGPEDGNYIYIRKVIGYKEV